jgi:hypothetical protein
MTISPQDFPDHNPSQVSVAIDSIIGTPQAGTAIAAGATLTAFSGFVNQLSIATLSDCLNANLGTSPNPFLRHALLWKDGQGGSQLDFEHWFQLDTNVVAPGNNGLVIGRAPTKGPFLTWLIKNMDAVNGVTVDAEILQSSRFIARPDYRSMSNNISGSIAAYGNSPAVPTPLSNPVMLLLGAIPAPGTTIAAGASVGRINALFCGQAALKVKASSGAAALNLNVQLLTVNPDDGGGNFTIPLDEFNLSGAANAATITKTNETLLRAPTIIVFTNNGSASCQAEYALAGQEFAS